MIALVMQGLGKILVEIPISIGGVVLELFYNACIHCKLLRQCHAFWANSNFLTTDGACHWVLDAKVLGACVESMVSGT